MITPIIELNFGGMQYLRIKCCLVFDDTPGPVIPQTEVSKPPAGHLALLHLHSLNCPCLTCSTELHSAARAAAFRKEVNHSSDDAHGSPFSGCLFKSLTPPFVGFLLQSQVFCLFLPSAML